MARRIKAAGAAFLMALLLVMPAAATQTGARTNVFFAAEQRDSLEQELMVRIVDPSADSQDPLPYASHVNRLTMDGAVYFVPQTDGPWITVDYLVDPEGDGIYDLEEENGQPISDVFTRSDGLKRDATPATLTAGEGYFITARCLDDRARVLFPELRDIPTENYLYMVLIHNVDQTGVEESDCYYLRLYEGELPALSAAHFQDVDPGSWYYGAVDYVTARGLMSGSAAGIFAPDQTLTRAALAQVLYAMEGKPVVPAPHFDDVPGDSWYASAVSWANQNGLMNGTGAGIFSPSALLTRQQLARILCNYGERKGLPRSADAALSSYPDGDRVAPWAAEAMEWAVNQGLLSGRTDGTLDPEGPVKRGEFACVLKKIQLLSQP